jgi:hypothetical protein
MAGYLPPMLIMTGLSYADKWKSTGSPTAGIPILLEGGIATAILAMVNSVPGLSGLATGIAWLALIGVAVNSSVVTSALNIVNGK